jgi:putative membrane protein
MAMAAADVVPGVSGGTVAFITGIYEELLYSIRAVDRSSLRLLFRLRFAEFWKTINGNFLLVLFAGILSGIFTVARLTMFLLRQHPIKTSSFFFGLILIAALLLLRHIGKWNSAVLTFLFTGLIVAYAVTRIAPVQTPNGLWFIVVVGVISGLLWLIPGISASYPLLFLGKVALISGAASEGRITIIFAFIAGCIIGILSFSRILTSFLKNYHSATVALLAGLMLGSLNKIWPWREVSQFEASYSGLRVPVFDRSILPWNYFEITGKDPQVFQAILMMALGVFIVVLIEKIAERLKTKI